MWFKSYGRNPFQAAAILDLATILVPRVTGSGTLAKSFQYDLSYICAQFGAFRLICVKMCLIPPTTMQLDKTDEMQCYAVDMNWCLKQVRIKVHPNAFVQSFSDFISLIKEQARIGIMLMISSIRWPSLGIQLYLYFHWFALWSKGKHINQIKDQRNNNRFVSDGKGFDNTSQRDWVICSMNQVFEFNKISIIT